MPDQPPAQQNPLLGVLRPPDSRLPLFLPHAFTMPPVPDDDERWAKLRERFGPADIERKPQILKKNDELKYGCEKDNGRDVSADGYYCGGYHARAIHIKYVGHANLTMRLNDVVGANGWAWLPMATNDDGTPKRTDGGMWIYLAILGHVKQGFGDAGGTPGTDGIKVTIGDAMRNAAMRFGIATYLWAKSDAALDRVRTAYPEDQPASAPRGGDIRRQQRSGPSPEQRPHGWDTPREAAPAAAAPAAKPVHVPPLRAAQARAWDACSALYPTWTQAVKQGVIEDAVKARLAKAGKGLKDAEAADWEAVAIDMENEKVAEEQKDA
jgi:hypothetical protein